jgi:hypothetical protein
VENLVEELAGTDVVVYLADTIREGGRAPGYLTFLASAAGVRYVVVHIDRWCISPFDRIAVLAHELQHAMEVAQAPEVRDEATLALFYRRIGWQSGAGRFETAKARDTGERVRHQLTGTPR